MSGGDPYHKSGGDLYQSSILERSRHPRFRHVIQGAPLVGRCSNPLCGDDVRVALRIDPDGTIEEAGFSAEGCAIMIASADLMLESVLGTDAAETPALGAAFAAMLGGGALVADPRLVCFASLRDFPARIRCAELPWDALAQAVATANGDAI